MGKTIAYIFADVNGPVEEKTMMQEVKPLKSLSRATDARISSRHEKMLRVWMI